MRRHSRTWIALAVAASSVALTAQEPAPAQPTTPLFRAATELIAIDATVVDQRGQPIAGLTPEDFELTVDGTPRRVVSAQFIRQDPPGPVPTLAGRPLPFTTNESAVGGRLILIVFDLEGIGIAGGRGAAVAASRFLDELTPADRVGMLAFPNGANINFTTDRERVRRALQSVVGRGAIFTDGIYAIGTREAFDMERGDTATSQRVFLRECANEVTDEGRQICRASLESQARSLVVEYRHRATNALLTLRSLLVGFTKIDAPKTVVWISEGLPVEEHRVEFGGLAALAASARTTIYSLHLDQTIIADASRGNQSPSMFADRQMAIEGLATIAGITRGAMFTSIGTGSNVFARIASELTAYYLLSAEPEPEDRDGRSHRIRVNVRRKDVSVRARREFTLAKEPPRPVSPEQRVASILGLPMLATDLPLKVATYNMRTPGASTVRVVVTGEFGRTAVAPEEAAVGYIVMGSQGKIVASAMTRNRAVPVRTTGPGPLQASLIIEVPPGRYTLRMAVVDGEGRGGSVEHELTALTSAAGGVDIADLLLAPASTTAQPTTVRLVADPTIDEEPFGAYLEVYPRSAEAARRTSVTVEIADDDTARPIATTKAPLVETREKGRYVAQALLPLGLVPPGEYVARAVVNAGGATSVQSRAFRLIRAVPAGEMFRADLASRVGTFTRDQVLTPVLLGPAIARARELDGQPPGAALGEAADALAAGRLETLDHLAVGGEKSVLASLLRGLAAYRAGRIEEAAGAFRESVRQSSEFLPGIFYLGACYAAGGRSREAVGAWQTSLVGDDSSPDVFQLLIDGFLRLGDTDAAIGAIEEAAGKWPGDYRFVVRATLASAAQDRPVEALNRLLPWLDRQGDDREALDLAMRLALADLASRPPGRREDAVARLKDMAARYEASRVPVPPLAGRWLTYLSGRIETQ